MARTNRVRSRFTKAPRGFYGGFTSPDIYTMYEYCDDFIGRPRGDGFLYLDRWDHNPVRINGNHNGIPVTNFVPDNHEPGGLHDMPSGMPSTIFATTKALANTNPNRRSVDVPVFLFELADLPKMLKSVGEDLLHLAAKKKRPPNIRDTITYSAGKNLEVQFGWIPLISDLGKFMDFENIVDKRVQELQRLASGKGLRRRITIWENELHYNGTAALQSSVFGASATYHIRNKGKCWTTLRWRLDPVQASGLPVNDRNIERLARRATLSLDWELRQGIDAASVWEAIPFSWFVDYFANVGDVLKAQRNEISVTPENMCIMYSHDSTCKFSNVVCNVPTLVGSPGQTTFRIRQRYVNTSPSPGLSASLGILNPSQWSILGSLAVLSLLGGKPGVQL